MMGCSCIYCDTDGSGYALDQWVEAIDERKCCECNRIIEKLEHYNRVRWWDSDYCEDCDDLVIECTCVEPDSIYCVCEDCQSIISTFYCDGYYFHQVIERLQDHIWDIGDRILSCDMSSLTKRARGIVCDMVEEHWADMDNEEEGD